MEVPEENRVTAEKMDSTLGREAGQGLKKVGLSRSRPGSDQELAIISNLLRRRISAGTVRASITSLLERMAKVGKGTDRAECRRGLVNKDEEG